jgi:hypothetical protein
MDDFISEDDLQTFEGWLRYQAVSPASADELEVWRRLFEEARHRSATAPKVGLMKLQPVAGEYRPYVGARERASSSSCCRAVIEIGTPIRATTWTARCT